MVTAGQRREGVVFLQGREVSQREGCRVVGFARSTCRYRSRRPPPTALLERLAEIQKEQRRCGYRKAWYVLRNEGQQINHKRVWRLWREAKLTLPRKRRRKRRGPKALSPLQAERPDHVWTYDFMHDATDDGRKLRLLTVLDEFTRESLAVEVERRMPAVRVIEALGRLFAQRGAPQYLRSDNGPEFVARVLRRWLEQKGVATHYIDPGSPWQNAKGESFNDKVREECLNLEVFTSLMEAKVVVEDWRRLYNERRPHQSLGGKTPARFAQNWRENNAGVLPLGDAAPQAPRSLPLSGRAPAATTQGSQNTSGPALTTDPAALSPVTALGSHSCGALSSEPVKGSVENFKTLCKQLQKPISPGGILT